MIRHVLPIALLACSTPTKPEPGSTAPPDPAKSETRARTPGIMKPGTLVLPGGERGIGFDDLRFSPGMHRVLAPAGRTGKLDLVDPRSLAIESVDGFSSE